LSHDTCLMHFENICRAPTLTHGKGVRRAPR
jgi:hypothetical protein